MLKFLLFTFILQYCTCNYVPRFKHNVHTTNTHDAVAYDTKYLSIPVDHFGYANQDMFTLRYLVAKQHWHGDGAPILFYTGNEGDITWFAENTGFMWDIAPEFGAMLVFAEHRYYGTSLPYGNSSYTDSKHLGYLTSEQALADFAALITYIRGSVNGAENSPFIAFGGSYGGMLSAWFRIKYPHMVQGALAASAPIWQFQGLTQCGTFYKTVTSDYARESEECVTNIRNSWAVINKMAKTESGRATLTSALRLCSPVAAGHGDVIKSWLQEIYTNLAMVDYPYPASFLEPLPAWPIKVFCRSLSDVMVDDLTLLKALAQSINVYMNGTGQATCFDWQQSATGNLGEQGWNFQACTEMVMPFCSNGIDDFFEAQSWNLTSITQSCQSTYGVTPRPRWIETQYGGKDLAGSSNIIFSNGLLDPWSVGGVVSSLSDSLVAIIIDEGAHHLDLRFANPDDPPSVILARNREKHIIHQWIEQYRCEYDNGRYWMTAMFNNDLMTFFGMVCIFFVVIILVRKEYVQRTRVLNSSEILVVHDREKDDMTFNYITK